MSPMLQWPSTLEIHPDDAATAFGGFMIFSAGFMIGLNLNKFNYHARPISPCTLEIHHLQILRIFRPSSRFHQQDEPCHIYWVQNTEKKRKQKSMNLMSLKISWRCSGPRIPSNWHPSQPLLQDLLAWLSGSASSKAKPVKAAFIPSCCKQSDKSI